MEKKICLISSNYIDEAIEKVFIKNGRNKIPDIELICSIACVDRKTVVKHLQRWWREHDFLNQNEFFLPNVIEFKRSPKEEIKLLQNHLDSLISEVELQGDSLNNMPDFSYPVANYLIQSLLDMQQKLSYLLLEVADTEELHNKLAQQFSIKWKECERLNKEVADVSANAKKKVAGIKKDLDKSRHESFALRALIKSLKKNKKHMNLMNYLVK